MQQVNNVVEQNVNRKLACVYDTAPRLQQILRQCFHLNQNVRQSTHPAIRNQLIMMMKSHLLPEETRRIHSHSTIILPDPKFYSRKTLMV